METKRYWKSIEDLKQDPAAIEAAQNEFGRDVPVDEILADGGNLQSNRRDFLKFFGFSLTAATLAACNKTPVKYAVPYVDTPDDLVPSIPNFYASTFYDGQEALNVLVKVRDGRPIKIEGNAQSPLNGTGNGIGGGVSARGHASILGLYDSTRLQHAVKKSGDGWAKIGYDSLDAAITKGLSDAAAAGKTIAVVSHSNISPSFFAALEELNKRYNNKVRYVAYDAVSSSAMLAANEASLGTALVPSYRFEKAKAIVGINADFLGTWLTPTQFSRDYIKGRKLSKDQKEMSRHLQFESHLSLTGSNADYRFPIRPSQEGLLVLNLYNAIAAKAGQPTYSAPKLELAGNAISMAANELWNNKGKALLVCGSNDVNVQVLVNTINKMVDAYSNTIEADKPLMIRQGRDEQMVQLAADMKAGTVGAVIFHGTNPSYTWGDAAGFEAALKNVALKVSFAEREDETAQHCDYIVPDSHFLESWSDAEPVAGQLSIVQPTIQQLFDTRQALESILVWAGNNTKPYDYIRNTWKGLASGSFESFWQQSLHDGFASASRKGSIPSSLTTGLAKNTVPSAGEAANALAGSKPATGLELVAYEKVGIGNGVLAGLPWLQELPDPITKAVWDNYAAVNVKDAEEQGLKMGDVVKVSNGKTEVELPVYVQPGQARGTVGIALGYGRTKAAKAALEVGKNAYVFTSVVGGTVRYTAGDVKLTKTSATYELALTQSHQTIMGRNIVKETTLAEWHKNPYSGNEEKIQLISLWEKHPKNGHYWAMAIDLNACTGCGSCVISCQVENNVPVVGRSEVRRGREMHWIRIDRYFSAAGTDAVAIEQGAEQPEVVFQPMLCQHCDNAPCETVCPVLATTHSSEGLNQMTYNRCIGTRYCANNCPYKVRRFNWFDYAKQDNRGRDRGNLTLNEEIHGTAFNYNPATDELGRLVLNPDVTVRSRGVMEKCSFCVQRLQAAKLEAKKEGRRVSDEQVQPACAQSCPSGAIIFGDLNDPDSRIAQVYNTERSYHVLEEVKTLPHISYQTKVRNKEATQA